ncbi:MAG: hypothetical protein DRJ01_00435 [Bacteroidetes bacterium]|nr:MAG: hypothetical protein DRJ01_00435 [Bacteroidota bacterium]
MAISLTTSKSSTLEPLKKNRFVMQFTAVPGGGDPSELAFAMHTATVPNITFNPTEAQRLNERFWTAGKPTYNDLAATFYDYIAGSKSSGQILYDWSQSIYNPITGQMYFKTQYSTSATMAQLDPAGGVVRLWNLYYVWPTNVSWGDAFSYDDDTISECSVTFKYDYTIKGNDEDTTPVF